MYLLALIIQNETDMDQTDRNGYGYRDGTQGVNCNGQRAGEYYITGYTAIRVIVRGGSLDLTVTPEEDWEFEIID